MMLEAFLHVNCLIRALLKPFQNKKGQKNWVSFSQLPAVKKDTIYGAARKNFGPSYFVTALFEKNKLG